MKVLFADFAMSLTVAPEQLLVLILSERVYDPVHDIDIQAHELFDGIIPRLAQEHGIDKL